MAERDFTFNIKINGRDELNETIKEMKQFVQTLKEAQELIEDLTRRCGYDVKDIAGRFKGIHVYGDGGGDKKILLSDDIQKGIVDLCDKKVSELEKEFETI